MVSLLGTEKKTELETLTKFLYYFAACQLGNLARSRTLTTVWVHRDHIEHVIYF